MTFAAPAMLYALLLLPVAIALYVAVQNQRKRYAVRFTNLDLLSTVVTASPRWQRHVPAALVLLSLASLIVATAKPEVETRVANDEASIILTLDTSGSMRANDVQPTRLDAARSAAKRFVSGLPEGVRVGLVSFSSRVDLLSPPVKEHDVVLDALDGLEADGGTAMGDGLRRALDLATSLTDEGEDVPAGESPVVIVLLSDGANTTGSEDPVTVATDAQSLGIPVYTIALGTDEGTVQIGPRVLPVPPDRDTLQEVAQTTGGRSFDAPTQSQLNQIYDSVGSRVGYSMEPQERTALFAGIAALLLAIAAALSMVWFGRLP